ncbi:cell wall-active antibiotics response protein [Parabacteroides sp. OttesenSCG-928-G07]|nr:cell wall-active antibiotics response protein [Parabacteroides sp. OttesenSCG-928-G07]
MSKHYHSSAWHRKINTLVTALVFIVVGIMFMGRNMGWIDSNVFSIVVSWQMLLVVIGVTQMIKRNIIAGVVLITIGTYFMLPDITNVSPDWLASFWPVLLIIIGVSILFKLRKPFHSKELHSRENGCEQRGNRMDTSNGFVKSDVNFGAAKHIVLEPVFRGADLDVAFGSISLDLRHTILELKQTEIRIDCSFGNVELFIPPKWDVVLRMDTTLGGVNDKRYTPGDIDYENQLILIGDVAFGGVEIKN